MASSVARNVFAKFSSLIVPAVWVDYGWILRLEDGRKASNVVPAVVVLAEVRWYSSDSGLFWFLALGLELAQV